MLQHHRLFFVPLLFQPTNPVYQILSGVRVTPETKFLSADLDSDLSVLREAHHFMHYAIAIYGWPMYLKRDSTGVGGFCKLCTALR